MSKKSEAKQFQVYVEKVIPMTCSNCTNCEPVMGERLVYVDPLRSAMGTHMAIVQTGQKCGIGGFAVKKMAACNLHVYATPNAKVSGAGTASAGLPGYAGDNNGD